MSATDNLDRAAVDRYRTPPIVEPDADCAQMMAAFSTVPPTVQYQGRSDREGLVARNQSRALRVAVAVTAYAYSHGIPESAADALTDLLNDARHLADALGVDWETVSRPHHYDDEVAGND